MRPNIYQIDNFIYNNKINNNSILHIYGNGVVVAEFTLKFVES